MLVLTYLRGEGGLVPFEELLEQLELLARICPQTWGLAIDTKRHFRRLLKEAIGRLVAGGDVERDRGGNAVRWLPPRPAAPLEKQGALFDG
jgi:hypothetical protein